MKKLILLSAAALMILAGCKKDGSGTKITALEFKKGLYEISENEDINLFKELVTTPDGIKDTCKVIWKVSDTEVAEMNGKYLTPIMPGDVKVTATVQNISATCNVSILPVPVESITLEDMTVALYGSSQIKCTTVPSGISLKRITFSSSDDDIAYVNSDGMVQGKGVGTAIITAKVDGKEAICTVKVEKKDVTSVTVSPKTYRFTSVGETLQLTATIEPSDASVQNVIWKSDNTAVATVNENGLVTCKGGGTATITATADGKKRTCTVSMTEYGTVKDCQNNTYKTVKIGEQWWMAENMRATKYSPNNTASKNLTISILQKGAQMLMSSPACIDASNRANWDMTYAYGQGTTDGLTDEMVGKLGYLYNWTAAVGVADGTEITTDFTGNRQGICPDGWHVPTDYEWGQLKSFVETTDEYGSGTAGKHLKSVNGWWNGSADYKPGADTYGFYALPAGVYQLSGKTAYYRLDYTGTHTVFWTCSLDPSSKVGYAQNRYMIYFYDELQYGNSNLWTAKNHGCSVRCVKN